MCKSGQSKAGGGNLARMRHLQGQVAENSAQGADPDGAKDSGCAADDVDDDTVGGGGGRRRVALPPPLPPVLRLLSADVLTEACTFLDATSLATAAEACRRFREVCHLAPHPWRLLCSREWGLRAEEEERDEAAKMQVEAAGAAAAAAAPRRDRLSFHDGILGRDFRRLFPLIEHMPSGFDCALLCDRGDDNNINNQLDEDNNNNGGGGDNQQAGGEAGEGGQPLEAAVAAGGGGGGGGAGTVDDAGAADNQAGALAAPPAALPPAPVGGAASISGGRLAPVAAAAASGEETGVEAGDFLVTGVRRRRQPAAAAAAASSRSSSSTASSSPGGTRSSPQHGGGNHERAAAAAVRGSPRSSSIDVALQVEFRGGVGVGNRCVRADRPLPSTVLGERTGLGARSSVAERRRRDLEDASPLALFRWLLAKMAATASGSGGGASGGSWQHSPAALSSTNSRLSFSSALPFSANPPPHHHQAQHAGGGPGYEYEEAVDYHEHQFRPGHHPAWGATEAATAAAAAAAAGATDGRGNAAGERTERSSSLPGFSTGGGGGEEADRRGWRGGTCQGGRRRQQQQQLQLQQHVHDGPALPRVVCFPVALGKGVVDVTPRLVSYFEVTIIAPRVDTPHEVPECIAVGVSEKGFPLRGKMPGWDALSYGYHSDDGGAFHDAGSMRFKCGPSFGPGDVVGCGLDYSVGDDRADIFFTLNGEPLNTIPNSHDNNVNNNNTNDNGPGGVPAGGGTGTKGGGIAGAAFRGVKGTFYPTVGVDSACPVRINLGGEPFKFDLASALQKGGQEAAARESVAQHEPRRSCSRPHCCAALSASGAAAAAAAAIDIDRGADPSPLSEGRPELVPLLPRRQPRQRSSSPPVAAASAAAGAWRRQQG